jgi:hypothetical protein
MTYINGVNLLPSTGEASYDTVPYRAKRTNEPDFLPTNSYHAPGGAKTDFSYSIDQLQAAFPGCETVSLIISWFGSTTNAATCGIYPSTTYIGGDFEAFYGGSWHQDQWRCSGLDERSEGLFPISSSGGVFSYGGTPSDQSIVRAIQDLKGRGFRVVFYPFILMDIPGSFPWRGRISYSPDRSAAAASAVASFLGPAQPDDFSRDAINLTVSYSGPPTDFTYRRMILHYAHLCVVAGGVDLFLIGSELRGLEAIRGPAWTKEGTIGSDGKVTWDYPFVDGLRALAGDVRGIFDGAGLTKDLSARKNLISYAADWSAWMGVQHTASSPSDEGQWPHLDQLYGDPNIDLVCFDNYLPLSDWTSAPDGLDVIHWTKPKPTGPWPPLPETMHGLGLTGTPTLHSKAYLKANIEGGEKFNWTYFNSENQGRGLDPNGSAMHVSLPAGDRLAQSRSRYYPNQELLANKQLRWWWKSSHKAVYPIASGGWEPHGAETRWIPQSKPITFTEYGYPTCDKGTNQPNVFFDPKSSESFTPFWSEWEPASGGKYRPKQDYVLARLALEAVHEYWFEDGNNEASISGIVMLERAFCCVWNWDARPFPTFPKLSEVWGDAGNWRVGNWIAGKHPVVAPATADPTPPPGAFPVFPTLAGQGWVVKYTPVFETLTNAHVSGRESRAARSSDALWEIEISIDILRMAPENEIEELTGFYAASRGADRPFLFPVAGELGLGTMMTCRFAGDGLDLEEFMTRLWRGEAIKIRSARGE